MRTPWDWEINKQSKFVRVRTSWGGFYIDVNLTGKINSLKIILHHWFSDRYPKLNLFLYILWYHKICKFFYPKTYKLKQLIKKNSQLLLLNIRYKNILQEMFNSAIEGQKNYVQNKN